MAPKGGTQKDLAQAIPVLQKIESPGQFDDYTEDLRGPVCSHVLETNAIWLKDLAETLGDFANFSKPKLE
eukprot:4735028-Karenia_brevis.AAC.1